MMRGGLLVTTLLACLAAGPVCAAAQAALSESYLVIKGDLGLGGSVGVQNDEYVLGNDTAPRPGIIPAQDASSDLKVSFGGQLQYLFGLHRFFAAGAAFGAHTWRSTAAEDAGEGTSVGIDIGLVAQGRIPIGPRFEVYVSLPLSLTLSILNEYKTWTERRDVTLGRARSVAPTYGFGIGVLAGARFALSGSFGVLAELGYQRYAFSHAIQYEGSVQLGADGVGTELDVDFVTEQVRLGVGVFF